MIPLQFQNQTVIFAIDLKCSTTKLMTLTWTLPTSSNTLWETDVNSSPLLPVPNTGF